VRLSPLCTAATDLNSGLIKINSKAGPRIVGVRQNRM
jgi:hypothetical protein